ncbi:DNA/RNA helicase, DEAD/DEAH box type, N-terminal, partial [Cynara cardunculus var. scolymus]
MASNGNGNNDEQTADHLSFARCPFMGPDCLVRKCGGGGAVMIEALEQAMKQNTIVFLETGSGKTLIAIMLLRRYAHLFRKPKPFISVFLVPTVVLVKQQAEAVRKHLDLKVEEYCGEIGVDYWNAANWKKQQDENELLVMTPAILLDALRHKFLSLDIIKVLIFDECHNAKKRHPYALIMTLPRILGMTASPVKAKVSNSSSDYWKQIDKLETLMNSKVNIIVATSILEEGLDVQSCNLVIRFDLSSTVCSFIQSRGRARMRDSDFLLLIR